MNLFAEFQEARVLPPAPETFEVATPGAWFEYKTKEATSVGYVVECVDCHNRFMSNDRKNIFTSVEAGYVLKHRVLCKVCASVPGRLLATRRAVQKIDVPLKYLNASLNDVSPKILKSKQNIRDWPSRTPFVLLAGELPVQPSVKTDPTYACWARIREMIKENYFVRVENCLALREKWFAPQSREQVTEKIVGAAYLVLDKFYAAEPKYGWQEFMLRVLTEREEQGRPTLVALHNKLGPVQEKFGSEITRALYGYTPLTLGEA